MTSCVVINYKRSTSWSTLISRYSCAFAYSGIVFYAILSGFASGLEWSSLFCRNRLIWKVLRGIVSSLPRIFIFELHYNVLFLRLLSTAARCHGSHYCNQPLGPFSLLFFTSTWKLNANEGNTDTTTRD